MCCIPSTDDSVFVSNSLSASCSPCRTCRLKSFGYCNHTHFIGIVPREAEATAVLVDQGASVVYSRHQLLSYRRSPAVRVLKSTHVNTLAGCGLLRYHLAVHLKAARVQLTSVGQFSNRQDNGVDRAVERRRVCKVLSSVEERRPNGHRRYLTLYTHIYHRHLYAAAVKV